MRSRVKRIVRSLVLFYINHYSAARRRIIKLAIPLCKSFSAETLIFFACFRNRITCAKAQFCNNGFYERACFVAVVSVCFFKFFYFHFFIFFIFFCRTGYFRQLLSRARFKFLFCLQKPVSLSAYCSQVQYHCSFRKSDAFFGSSFSRTR